MKSKGLTGTFKLKILNYIDDIPENNIETLRFLVEEDLRDLGYFAEVIILDEKEDVI